MEIPSQAKGWFQSNAFFKVVLDQISSIHLNISTLYKHYADGNMVQNGIAMVGKLVPINKTSHL